MDIRAITLGINPTAEKFAALRLEIPRFFTSANAVFAFDGLAVRTNRILLPPFNSSDVCDRFYILENTERISQLCQKSGIRWFCLPISTFGGMDYRELHDTMLEIAVRYKNAFLNIIAVQKNQIDLGGIHFAGRLIKSISRLSNNGYDNFRLGISCNCRAHTPFFPFSYHEGEAGFSLGLEFARDFVDIIEAHSKDSLKVIRECLVRLLVAGLERIENAALRVEQETNLRYYGTDISLAPFPEGNHSVALIIERMGMEGFGGNGTLFFTSYLTDILNEALKRSGIRSVGFCGVMFSLLEDTSLGVHNNFKAFSIDSLLSYCSVCGCGLDMIPIPGDTFEEEISSLILDVAAMSTTLNKPLGVRLLPIPLKHVNEFTSFEYDFLTNTRIKDIKNRACKLEVFDNQVFNYAMYKGGD